jgi:hypothetical protein
VIIYKSVRTEFKFEFEQKKAKEKSPGKGGPASEYVQKAV